MKKFRFRLQKVLEYRGALKKERERELAARNSELRDAETRVSNIIEAQNAAGDLGQEVLRMADLQAHGDYYASLQRALVEERLNVLEAAEAVERARQAYIEKAIEEETLAKLKERRQEQHRETAQKEERKQLDAMVTQRFRFTRGNR